MKLLLIYNQPWSLKGHIIAYNKTCCTNADGRAPISGEYQRKEENLGVLVKDKNATLDKRKLNARNAE